VTYLKKKKLCDMYLKKRIIRKNKKPLFRNHFFCQKKNKKHHFIPSFSTMSSPTCYIFEGKYFFFAWSSRHAAPPSKPFVKLKRGYLLWLLLETKQNSWESKGIIYIYTMDTVSFFRTPYKHIKSWITSIYIALDSL